MLLHLSGATLVVSKTCFGRGGHRASRSHCGLPVRQRPRCAAPSLASICAAAHHGMHRGHACTHERVHACDLLCDSCRCMRGLYVCMCACACVRPACQEWQPLRMCTLCLPAPRAHAAARLQSCPACCRVDSGEGGLWGSVDRQPTSSVANAAMAPPGLAYDDADRLLPACVSLVKAVHGGSVDTTVECGAR